MLPLGRCAPGRSPALQDLLPPTFPSYSSEGETRLPSPLLHLLHLTYFTYFTSCIQSPALSFCWSDRDGESHTPCSSPCGNIPKGYHTHYPDTRQQVGTAAPQPFAGKPRPPRPPGQAWAKDKLSSPRRTPPGCGAFIVHTPLCTSGRYKPPALPLRVLPR